MLAAQTREAATHNTMWATIFTLLDLQFKVPLLLPQEAIVVAVTVVIIQPIRQVLQSLPVIVARHQEVASTMRISMIAIVCMMKKYLQRRCMDTVLPVVIIVSVADHQQFTPHPRARRRSMADAVPLCLIMTTTHIMDLEQAPHHLSMYQVKQVVKKQNWLNGWQLLKLQLKKNYLKVTSWIDQCQQPISSRVK